MVYNGTAVELQSILVELYRLNAKGAPPVFTNKGKALTDIKYEAQKLKNGVYGTYPPYTSEGQLLDDIATLLNGVVLGGETPVTTVLTVGTTAPIISGTPTGTITCRKYLNRMEFDYNITGAAAWSVGIPYDANIVGPNPSSGIYFEHQLSTTSGTFLAEATRNRINSGASIFNHVGTRIYAI